MSSVCSERRARQSLPLLRPGAALMVITMFVLLLTLPVQAGTLITVNETNDELNSDGDCSLREALYAANNDTTSDACPAGSGMDTISIPAGTYSITISGFDDLGEQGDLDILDDLVLEGAGVGATIIDGGPGGLGHSLIEVPNDTYSLSVVIKDLTIQNNQTGGYPGAANFKDYDSTVELQDCNFNHNTTVANAGAIWNDGTLIVRRCTFDSNVSGSNGGAIYSPGDMYIYESTFSGNEATVFQGGAISMNGGYLHIENSTFTGNSAGENGGALRISVLEASLSNVTVTGNTADLDDDDVGNGGGVYFTAGTSITVSNSIIAGNSDASTTGTPVVHPDCSIDTANTPTVVSGGHNLIGDASGCSAFTNAVNGDQVGTSGSPIDPMLATLADNGGPTQTMALQTGSPAIDAGDPTGCDDKDGVELGTDQRGYVRPMDGTGGGAICDIGAYELMAGWPPNDPPGPVMNILRIPSSIVRGAAPSGPNQWFVRLVLDDNIADELDRFQFVVWLHVPEDWTLPWSTQYSFTGDFGSGPIWHDVPAYTWVQTPNCPLGGAPEVGYKWRAFRGYEEIMPATGSRLDNRVNLRGGLGVPSGEDLGVYQVRVIVGTYYDHTADAYADRYHCDLIGVAGVEITD